MSAVTRGLDNVGTQTSSSKGDTKLRNTETAANVFALKGVTGRAKAEGVNDPVHESRHIDTGRDILDNNGVNVLMASIMSFGAVFVASWIWDLSIVELFI